MKIWRMRIALTICNTAFHYNNSCNNTPECHVIRKYIALPISLELPLSFSISIIMQQMKARNSIIATNVIVAQNVITKCC